MELLSQEVAIVEIVKGDSFPPVHKEITCKSLVSYALPNVVTFISLQVYVGYIHGVT